MLMLSVQTDSKVSRFIVRNHVENASRSQDFDGDFMKTRIIPSTDLGPSVLCKTRVDIVSVEGNEQFDSQQLSQELL